VTVALEEAYIMYVALTCARKKFAPLNGLRGNYFCLPRLQRRAVPRGEKLNGAESSAESPPPAAPVEAALSN